MTTPVATADTAQAMVGVEAMLAAGISYRCLDYWSRRGWLRTPAFAGGSGRPRAWPAREVDVARVMRRLIDAGIRPATAHDIARTTAAGGGHLELASGIRITVDTPEGKPCTCVGTATPR